MARFSRLFARKQAQTASDEQSDDALWPSVQSGPPSLDPGEDAPATLGDGMRRDPPDVALVPATPPDSTAEWSPANDGVEILQPVPAPAAPARIEQDAPDAIAAALAVPAAPERRASALLIGGDEEDIVPVIPDTTVEFQAAGSEFDEEATMQAAIDALMSACTLTVSHVKALRALQDGTQVVAGLIALAGDLDARYAADWGVVRRNGLEPVLDQVRDSLPEADQFILESLEDGQGGLTAENFLRDLRTIAAADRPRMVANYVGFLCFLLHCILRQYLSPLQQDPARLRDVTARLDYLIDGIRDTLLARVRGVP